MTATHYIGLGHETRADPAAALALVQQCCRQAGLAPGDIALIASLESKAADDIVASLARHFGWAVQYFSAAALETETPRLLNPSDLVFRAVGCHGVAEAAALAAAGPDASLVIPKTATGGITCAIARRDGDGR
jgi:cobalamin biosynthesis protein CbiG